MDERERAEKDIQKLKKIISIFKEMKLDKTYPVPLSWAENYLKDAVHYFDKKDYFTSFGCVNYAYGIIDGILILTGNKNETTI
ncbi:DUF357 domain-containing protein [Candidatus Micrarchaeota archaeon]|nr:DUF357 domain-containing protein [Candidatus Micrarchaeota archaeon]